MNESEFLDSLAIFLHQSETGKHLLRRGGGIVCSCGKILKTEKEIKEHMKDFRNYLTGENDS